MTYILDDPLLYIGNIAYMAHLLNESEIKYNILKDENKKLKEQNLILQLQLQNHNELQKKYKKHIKYNEELYLNYEKDRNNNNMLIEKYDKQLQYYKDLLCKYDDGLCYYDNICFD
jgi:hypothetical protein